MDQIGLTLLLFGLIAIVTAAVRLVSGGRIGGYVGRLNRVADHVKGNLVLERSTVGGHVVWSRAGFPFFFYEKDRVPGRWTILSVDARGLGIPDFELRPRSGTVPSLPQPVPLEENRLWAGLVARYQLRAAKGGDPAIGLSEETQRLFLEVALGHGRTLPFLEVLEGRIRLYHPGLLPRSGERARLESMCRVLESILGRQCATGVKLLETEVGGSTHPRTPLCQVCGEPILGGGVRCVRCDTPHHADCWAYAGGCSTFGCAGITAR